jgi:hypothetical protein
MDRSAAKLALLTLHSTSRHCSAVRCGLLNLPVDRSIVQGEVEGAAAAAARVVVEWRAMIDRSHRSHSAHGGARIGTLLGGNERSVNPTYR